MEKWDKVDSKLDRIEERLDRIDVTLERNTGSLEKHMLRTELGERRLEHMEEALKPIIKHVNMLEGILKLFGALAVLGSIITAIIKVLEIL